MRAMVQRPSVLLRASTLTLLCCSLVKCTLARNPQRFRETMVRATCRVVGGSYSGTGFFVGPMRPRGPDSVAVVLVTAGHVLDTIEYSHVQLWLRAMRSDSTYIKRTVPVRIRTEDGVPIYTRPASGEVDVAALTVSIPSGLAVASVDTGLLARVEHFDMGYLQIGNRLECLGYPLNQGATEAYLPILRGGWIASVPISPAKGCSTLLFDFSVYQGNSGGPVFFVNEGWHYHPGGIQKSPEPLVVGLVTDQMKGVNTDMDEFLSLAGVVPGPLLLDVVRPLVIAR